MPLNGDSCCCIWRAVQVFDYVVVGSGSAGAIVARRLAEDASVSVLLLEAGGRDNSLLLRIPAAMRYVYHMPKFNWSYSTEPEPYLNNRILEQPRGKVLGGSSSINGQLYLRGHPLDFESWAETGVDGWSYADVLPYFKRLETRVDGHSEYGGSTGPIKVSTAGAENPLTQAFLRASKEAGYLQTEDVNGAQQDGFGLLPKNIANGIRSSTSQCYLRKPPANLKIKLRCHVYKLLVDGREVKGVLYYENGREESVAASREVVLSAGAINSPMILMHSGIGPLNHLLEHGIDVVHDSPGVGENLMDHPITSLQLLCTKPVTLAKHLSWFAKINGLLRWLLTRDGFLADNHFDAAGFVRSDKGVSFPDLQFSLFQIAVSGLTADFIKEHAFQIQISHQRPLSRGYVKLSSADFRAKPRIRFNQLECPEDMEVMKSGLRLARELTQQPSLQDFTGEELFPGKEISSDSEIEEWLRENCGSSYHPCGTCKMGVESMSVVDSEGRVRGVEKLRIADASIMPLIPSANLNSPSMMIGEKVADLAAGKQPLPASELPYFTDPQWKFSQR